MDTIEKLAMQANMPLNKYRIMIEDSWIIDHTYQCPECPDRVPNGETCSCKASDRL
jgi:hypothetical protein